MRGRGGDLFAHRTFGKTDAFKAAVPVVKASIQGSLRSAMKAGGTGPLRKVLRDARARLGAAAHKHAAPRRYDVEHDPPGRFVQGGAPGLGKRR